MDVTVRVCENTYKFSIALADFVRDIRQALDDGWQPASDIPALVISGVKRLAPVVAGIPEIPDELKSKPEFERALALGFAELIEAITEK